MKNYFMLALAFMSVQLLCSQEVKFVERIEFEIKDGYIGETFYEMGKSGVLVRSHAKDDTAGETEWKYELYNTDLEVIWTESVMLPKRMYADETYLEDNAVHTLYKDKKGNFMLVTINADDEEVTEVGGEVLKKTYISEMAVLGEYAYCKAFIKGSPHLFSVNWLSGKQKLIPIEVDGYKSKSLKVESFQVLEESDQVMLYITAIGKKKNTETYVILLDDEGNKLNEYQLSKNIEVNIIDVSGREISDGSYIFTGTYGLPKGKGTKGNMSSSIGLFFCKAYEDEIDFIELYPFTELDNFLSYLPEKKQKKLEKKKKKKEKKGKEFNINYRIADHEIKVLEDGYMFLGEAYYPTYRTESYTTTGPNGTMVTKYRTVFDGYQYTHAVVARFDKRGGLEWDQTFKMFPAYKPYSVKRFIEIGEGEDDELAMVFASSRRIYSKIIDADGEVIQDEESDTIELNKESEEIKYSTANLDHWYKEYFLAYGYQKIKDKEATKRKDKKRKVYYMTKIMLD